jgi:hypothetical protein
VGQGVGAAPYNADGVRRNGDDSPFRAHSSQRDAHGRDAREMPFCIGCTRVKAVVLRSRSERPIRSSARSHVLGVLAYSRSSRLRASLITVKAASSRC